MLPSKNILLVEDNAIQARLMVHVLQSTGYSVTHVDDGWPAIDLAMQGDHPVILMDLNMPHLDGFEATRIIRANEPASRHTIVVALTAHDNEQVRQRCENAGMDAYIVKPIRPHELTEVLRTLLVDAA